MNSTVIKIENISKEYRLGVIGGGTLRGDLQSLWARTRGKEDPNTKLGTNTTASSANKRFMALDGISFSVSRGERIGIIGHNGAGKSTLLKLLSRVTAPSDGTISYNGRIASMLEVGTGFHSELTGRENVYLNGAILGMTKAEITSKFDDIVRFAEMEEFIDTPVKRYSSGMYVKLAFAVAAHLDADILIMDEVLAVGDMKFQQKCLSKMDDVSRDEGRTILYVSHNMNTIRQLCTRCIVLDHGKLVFDGDVEEAIKIYMASGEVMTPALDLRDKKRVDRFRVNPKCKMTYAAIESHPDGHVHSTDKLRLRLDFDANDDIDGLRLRVIFRTGGQPAATAFLGEGIDVKRGSSNSRCFEIDTSLLAPGMYETVFVLYSEMNGYSMDHDTVWAVTFEKVADGERDVAWRTAAWGNVRLDDITVI